MMMTVAFSNLLVCMKLILEKKISKIEKNIWFCANKLLVCPISYIKYLQGLI